MQQLHGHTDAVFSVAWSFDRRSIASGSADYSVIIWHVQAGTPVQHLREHKGYVFSVAWSFDGRQIASGSSDNSIIIWDAEAGKQMNTLLGHTGSVTSVAWSLTGRIISGSDDQKMMVWHPQSSTPLHELVAHGQPITSVAWSCAGGRFVSGGQDKRLILWDAQSNKPYMQLRGHTGYVNSVAWSSTGRCIASGSHDQKVCIFDAQSGKPVRQLVGHTDFVNSVAWSCDGRRIVSGGADKSVIIWDAEAGQAVHTLRGHAQSVTSVAFSFDGRRIASSSADKSIIIWDAQAGAQPALDRALALMMEAGAQGIVRWFPTLAGHFPWMHSLDHIVRCKEVAKEQKKWDLEAALATRQEDFQKRQDRLLHSLPRFISHAAHAAAARRKQASSQDIPWLKPLSQACTAFSNLLLTKLAHTGELEAAAIKAEDWATAWGHAHKHTALLNQIQQQLSDGTGKPSLFVLPSGELSRLCTAYAQACAVDDFARAKDLDQGKQKVQAFGTQLVQVAEAAVAAMQRDDTPKMAECTDHYHLLCTRIESLVEEYLSPQHKCEAIVCAEQVTELQLEVLQRPDRLPADADVQSPAAVTQASALREIETHPGTAPVTQLDPQGEVKERQSTTDTAPIHWNPLLEVEGHQRAPAGPQMQSGREDEGRQGTEGTTAVHRSSLVEVERHHNSPARTQVQSRRQSASDASIVFWNPLVEVEGHHNTLAGTQVPSRRQVESLQTTEETAQVHWNPLLEFQGDQGKTEGTPVNLWRLMEAHQRSYQRNLEMDEARLRVGLEMEHMNDVAAMLMEVKEGELRAWRQHYKALWEAAEGLQLENDTLRKYIHDIFEACSLVPDVIFPTIPECVPTPRRLSEPIQSVR